MKIDNPITETLDQMALAWIMMYYWPFFLAGNADNIKDILNIKPMCFR